MTFPLFALNAQQSLKNGDLSAIRHIQKGCINQQFNYSTTQESSSYYCYVIPTIGLSGFYDANKMIVYFDGTVEYQDYNWVDGKTNTYRNKYTGVGTLSGYDGYIMGLTTSAIQFNRHKGNSFSGNATSSDKNHVDTSANLSHAYIKGWYQVVEFY